jgi:hypothetical protein
MKSNETTHVGHVVKAHPRTDSGTHRRIEIGLEWHLRCVRRTNVIRSVSELLPARVSVMPDGTTCAHYSTGGGTLYFNDLAHLLAHHGLSMRDFEEEAG